MCVRVCTALPLNEGIEIGLHTAEREREKRKAAQKLVQKDMTFLFTIHQLFAAQKRERLTKHIFVRSSSTHVFVFAALTSGCSSNILCALRGTTNVYDDFGDDANCGGSNFSSLFLSLNCKTLAVCCSHSYNHPPTISIIHCSPFLLCTYVHLSVHDNAWGKEPVQMTTMILVTLKSDGAARVFGTHV